MSFLGEIKRRKVFQVAAVYLVVAWLLVQIVATIETPLSLPNWADTLVIVLLAVGFPIAIVLGWAFDLTARGVERTGPARPGESELSETMAATTGLAVNLTVVAVLSVLLVLVGLYVFWRDEPASTAGDDDAGSRSPVMVADERELLPNSVAVLPFDNLSPDPDNEFFAAGIHEEILNHLAKIRALSVISRTSVLPYAETTLSIPEIADNLRVQAVMEGSVRFADGRVRIQAQLIDAATDQHLWAEAYERPLSGIFEIQAEIAQAIAGALQAELLPTERAMIERPLTESLDAHRLYLQAISAVGGFLGSGPDADRNSFNRYLDAALALDPEFSRVHALKAVGYAERLGSSRHLTDDPSYEEMEQLAREHAERALMIDPNEGLAYNALAQIHEVNWRGAEAQEMHERALQLSPNDPDVLNDFSSFYMRSGRHDDAIRLAERLMELDPVGGTAWTAFVNVRAGNFETALELVELALARGADNEMLRLYRVSALRYLGRQSEALAILPPLAELAANPGGWDLYEYGRLGFAEQVRARISELDRFAETRSVGAATRAIAYLGVGEYDLALEWLELAAGNPGPGEGFNTAHWVAHNLIHEPALEQPQFLDVRERLRFREWPIAR